MTDEQWLREGLADAVPEPPANPDRARSAERLARRRRRTTTLAVLGTAGAVAAVSVLGVTLLSGDDDPDSANDPTSEAPAFVVECPPIEVDKGGFAQGSELDQPDPGAADAVPQDATSARLCQGPGSAIDVPDEALVRGVDDLVAAVNGLVVAPEDQFCTQELGPGFRIAFGYDDRSTFVVSGQLYGCRTVVVGSTYRNGADAARAAVLDLLADQRQAEGGSAGQAEPSAPSCSDTPTGTPSAKIGFTAAILCIKDGLGTQLSVEIDPADLGLLLRDMTLNQSDAQLRCAAPPPWPTIVGTLEDGSVITITSECATSFWRLPNGRAWTPGKDAVAILDGLVEAAQ